MNTFDFIRNSLNRIADGIASSDGSYPVWDYRALMELMNTLEKEYKKNDEASARSSLQQTCNNLATDTISRASAIAEITEYGSGRTVYMSVGELKRRIEQLPSAKPEERTETHVRDLISRAAAIDACTKAKVGAFPHDAGVNNSIKALKALPSAQWWIPTSEKLPDELAEVNVTWENTEPESYYDFVKGHCFTGTAVYFRGRWYWYSAVCTDYLKEYGFSPNDEMDDAIKVLAWMPMPEPYSEER